MIIVVIITTVEIVQQLQYFGLMKINPKFQPLNRYFQATFGSIFIKSDLLVNLMQYFSCNAENFLKFRKEEYLPSFIKQFDFKS